MRRVWRGGLAMSTPAVGDIAATEEVEDKPSRASVMDELDAILGDAKMVSGEWLPWRVRGRDASPTFGNRQAFVKKRVFALQFACVDTELMLGPATPPLRRPTTPERKAARPCAFEAHSVLRYCFRGVGRQRGAVPSVLPPRFLGLSVTTQRADTHTSTRECQPHIPVSPKCRTPLSLSLFLSLSHSVGKRSIALLVQRIQRNRKTP